jgi:hypothetical protein
MLPWNHTIGGNVTFQGNLAEGGTTYIDEATQVPRAINSLAIIQHQCYGLY